MRNVLDDQRAISRCDSGGMLSAIESFPHFMTSQLSTDVSLIKKTGRSALRNVIFLGMGGSASAADVVTDWSKSKILVPAMVHRDPLLPKFVGADTVSVVLSYSGETRESLFAFREATKRGSTIVSIGTGGRLQTLSERSGVPFVKVQKAPAPRAALGQMIIASILALHRLGVLSDPRTEIELTTNHLKRLSRSIQPSVPLQENPAKQLAVSLKNRFPTIFAFSRMASVARRFKNQLSENSKVAARYSLLPEAGHNEIEAWHNQRFPMIPVFVRDQLESVLERRLLESFRSTVRTASGISPEQVRLKAHTRLGALLHPILFLDYVSVYLAFLRGIDPTDTPWIRLYRQRQ